MSLKIVKDEKLGIVSIQCPNSDGNTLDGFIDIFTNDETVPSPFKRIDDAETFAKIIVKLLENVHDFN